MKILFLFALLVLSGVIFTPIFAQVTDTDGDGISDSIDQCPTQPETLNGYQDTDGCPDTNPATTDTDGDGISDSIDQCPTQPETVNGFTDLDGCPDVVAPKDTDNDGIDDKIDQCPTQAETVNGSDDSDGCPDVVTLQDSDKDGIVNSADTCPRSPETFNGFQDTDGCPDNLPNTIKFKLPSYFKNTAGSWADGQITDYEYLQRVQIEINRGTSSNVAY